MSSNTISETLLQLVDKEVKTEGSWPQSLYSDIQSQLLISTRMAVNQFIIFVLNKIDAPDTLPRERLKLSQLLKLLSLSEINDIQALYQANQPQFQTIIQNHKSEPLGQAIAQYLQDCFLDYSKSKTNSNLT